MTDHKQKGRPCGICTSDKLVLIDADLAVHRPLADISRSYGFDRRSIARHRDHHFDRDSVISDNGDDAGEMRQRLRALVHRAERVLGDVERGGSATAFSNVARELRLTLVALNKADRENGAGRSVSILLSDEWVRVRTTVLDALEPFPDARVAVAERLMTL